MNLTLLSHSHIIIAQLRPSHPVVELPKKKVSNNYYRPSHFFKNLAWCPMSSENSKKFTVDDFPVSLKRPQGSLLRCVLNFPLILSKY